MDSLQRLNWRTLHFWNSHCSSIQRRLQKCWTKDSALLRQCRCSSALCGHWRVHQTVRMESSERKAGNKECSGKFGRMGNSLRKQSVLLCDKCRWTHGALRKAKCCLEHVWRLHLRKPLIFMVAKLVTHSDWWTMNRAISTVLLVCKNPLMICQVRRAGLSCFP